MPTAVAAPPSSTPVTTYSNPRVQVREGGGEKVTARHLHAYLLRGPSSASVGEFNWHSLGSRIGFMAAHAAPQGIRGGDEREICLTATAAPQLTLSTKISPVVRFISNLLFAVLSGSMP